MLSAGLGVRLDNTKAWIVKWFVAMKFVERVKIVLNAPKFFILNCYDAICLVKLRLQFLYLQARIRKLALQRTNSEKMLKPGKHDLCAHNVKVSGASDDD